MGKKQIVLIMEEEIKKLEKELADLKSTHRSCWDTYGSELCAGDMIREEEKIEKKIEQLKLKNISLSMEDPKYIIDD